jgi:paraquat-inducible protein B
MTDIYLPQPTVSAKRHFAPIWILPIIALLVGIWLVWRSLLDIGPQITIEFDQGDGVVPNQTQVKYKGIVIGVVKSMDVKDDLSGVVAHIQLQKGVGQRFGGIPKETLFWLVQPQVSLGGVSGLNTLFSGNYIGVELPMNEVSGEHAEHFVALKAQPPLSPHVPGLHLKFKSDRLGSVSVGTPIFSRQIQVGAVHTAVMAKDGSMVEIGVHILPEYQHLVRKNTRFWNVSGVQIEAGLSGIRVETESVISMLAGGIAMSIPDDKEPPSENGQEFWLHADFESAEASAYINVEFPSAQGLTKNVTKVMYRDVVVGKLRDIWYDSKKDRVFGRFGIDPRFESFITDKTRFWLVKPQLSSTGITGLNTLISGSYLAFTPSKEGAAVRDHTFVAASGPDPLNFDLPGLHLELTSKVAGSLANGAPVYYREFVVGQVENKALDRDQAIIHIVVWPEYRHLINRSSRFWQVGGVQMDATFRDGIQIKSAPMLALLAGGVAFDTPDASAKKDVRDGQSFKLFGNEKLATAPAAGSAPGLYLTLESPDANGVNAGAPILHRELQVGTVQEVHHSADGEHVELRIQIDPKHQALVKPGVRFWRAGGVEADVGSNGVQLRTGTLANLFLGGVAFEQIEDAAVDAKPVQRDDRFRLYVDRTAAEQAGLSVQLELRNAEGISIGSDLRYRGMKLGEITRLQLRADMKGVVAGASLRQDAASLLTSGTHIWKVTPALGLARTAHLDTVLGSYLDITPGEGEPQLAFVVVDQEPVQTRRETGLNLQLEATQLGSIKSGDPVLFRQVKVGEVLGSDLTEDGKHVKVYINVWPQYSKHVHVGSRFWNASGVRVKAGLFSGVNVDTESLESILSGGIAFTADPSSGAAPEGQLYTLHDTE